MKTRYAYFIWLVFSIGIYQVYAQEPVVQDRSADTTIYYVENSLGSNAVFTWNITGGIIPGHGSSYTAEGADSIEVIWNDSCKSCANKGTLTVYKIVSWPDGNFCISPEEQISVEAWSRPKATADTNTRFVCSQKAFDIELSFEGKPGYQYQWKLYDKNNPSLVLEDHTDEYTSSGNPFTSISIAGITNTSEVEKQYVFELTALKDALDDGMPEDLTEAKKIIVVRPQASAGQLKYTNYLKRR